MTSEDLLALYETMIPPAWIDYNGHLNVAYYVLAFDHATDAFADYLRMDSDYRERTNCSIFVMETHVSYERELVAGDPIFCTTQLLDFDNKRIHYFHRMHHAREQFLAATTEILLLHVDLNLRRSVSMPSETLDRLGALMARHAQLPRPPQAGRVMGIPQKTCRGG